MSALPPATRLDQSRASDPAASAWVSANAGSGKTFVLVQRVTRLLLAGVPPGRVLALTYTKAAAAHMANRVFERLAGWVALSDRELADVIHAIEGRAPEPARLTQARRLFARAVETPGGLKIQTIHAFCERLLQMFPFEANVAARFEVLDERLGAEYLGAAREAVLREAAGSPGSPLAAALGIVAGLVSPDQFAALLREIGALRPAFRAGGPGAADALARDMRLRLGLAPGDSRESLSEAALTGGLDPGAWLSLAQGLGEGIKTDRELGQNLARAAAAASPEERLSLYLGCFLTREGTPRARMTGADLSKKRPDLAAMLSAEQSRITPIVEKLRALDAWERTRALYRLAEAVFARYDAAKSRRGALDFDDLIAKSVGLLERHGAAWVLFKLDRGIDHVLVDEAQDTSREQWRILDRLTAEFFAGRGARGGRRTVFAVGDPKQSIYSFQGAAPDAFEEARARFKRLVEAAEEPGRPPPRFEDVRLTLSFRSAPAILSAVDAVFSRPESFKGLSFDPTETGTTHVALRRRAAGLVELWDIEAPGEQPPPDGWTEPPDQKTDAPVARLADKIARRVAGWLRPDSPERVEDETSSEPRSRPIRAGDVLILVRSRGALFDALIRALKERGVPVAGADRLNLAEHIAVMDLLALGQASLTPEDDLALAETLKSPLIGLDDADLLTFAPRRPGSLADALADAAKSNPRLGAAQERLTAWRDQAARLGPFAFYAGLLGPQDGRRAMLARLGPEAGDAVDEFLRLAQDHERRETASLQLFLSAFAEAAPTVKRDMDGERDEARVMTVHGAKGLEAPVVFLPDTCAPPGGPGREKLIHLPGPNGAPGRELPAWSPSKPFDASAMANAREEARETQSEEYRRLLYVAMTRARDRLYVAGYRGAKSPPKGCWYELIEAGLAGGLIAHEENGARVRRWRGSHVPAPEPSIVEDRPDATVPDWLNLALEPEPAARPPLRPSSALDAADDPPRPGDGPFVRQARATGLLVHALLERLPLCPPARRPAAAIALANARAPALPAERRAALIADALAILADPALAALFGPASRAEIAVAGTIEAGGRSLSVSGQIDRLAVTADAVLIADYKTNALVPESDDRVPLAYCGQLAIYRELARKLYPGREIKCLLVWTSGPKLMRVADDQLTAALALIKPA